MADAVVVFMVNQLVKRVADAALPVIPVTRMMMVSMPKTESEGGFESDTNSPNKGMAILLRRTTFRAFVISDVIAFACSTAAVFAYFLMETSSISSATTELKFIIELYNMAVRLKFLAMTAVVVAFSTGLYVTLAHSVGLAITVCVINGISFYGICGMIVISGN
ncbi:hypothetical protein FXO38_20334 [Capsicum annuum]|nr:hypothetical protein FXO37_27221 [Capsicum annuum]KAF3644143.1 hypothetical protein FXO38_20334 [Capsicum annuum]